MEYKEVHDIKPREIDSKVIVAPFDKAKEILEKDDYKIISLKENAKLRIQEGSGSYISKNGNWTREGTLYLPDGGIYLVSNNPIMQNPEEATNANRDAKDFYLTDEQVKKSLEGSIDLDGGQVPVNRFAEDPRTSQIFGEIAGDYGKFLEEYGIKQMPIWLANPREKPFVRPLWFSHVVSESGLGGGYRSLSIGDRVRGVRVGEAAQKNSDNYTLSQISKALDMANLKGIEKTLLEHLKE